MEPILDQCPGYNLFIGGYVRPHECSLAKQQPALATKYFLATVQPFQVAIC